MTECEKLHPLLAGYLGEELTPDVRARVASHVSACTSCAEHVDAFARLEETLAAAAEPRWQIPPTLDQRLQRAVQEEIKRSKGRTLFSLRRALRAQYLLAGVPAVAAVIALIVCMFHDPPPAAVLAASVAAMKQCQTIHASGTGWGWYEDEVKRTESDARPTRASHPVALEIWHTSRGQEWVRRGEDVWVADANTMVRRSPLGRGTPTVWDRSTFGPGGYKSLIAGRLDAALGAVQHGAKVKTERHRGLLTITVHERLKSEVRTFVITIARSTKRLRFMSVSFSEPLVFQRLEFFEYDRPLPPGVAADIQRLTKGSPNNFIGGPNAPPSSVQE